MTGAAWHDSGVSAAWVHSAREKSFSLAETARQRRSCTSFGRALNLYVFSVSLQGGKQESYFLSRRSVFKLMCVVIYSSGFARQM